MEFGVARLDYYIVLRFRRTRGRGKVVQNWIDELVP